MRQIRGMIFSSRSVYPHQICTHSKESQMKVNLLLKNDEGAVLVIAMLVLLLLTLMGKVATTTSTVEMGIAGNERFYKKTLYAAETGLGHVREMLQAEFRNSNRARIASGQYPDWDFALNGSVAGIDAAVDTNFDGGAIWILDQDLGDGTGLFGSYTVTIWNNPDDGGGATNDTDQLLCVRSAATGPKGTKSSVEVILLGQASGEAITGYFAQAGGGAGKNSNSRDVRAISDFTGQ